MNYKEAIRDWEWRQCHSRFGMAGEMQADLIEKYLKSHPGLVLNVGCAGRPDAMTNLAAHSTVLIVVDKDPDMLSSGKPNPTPPNAIFILSDAHNIALGPNTVDHILALGLFAYIEETRTVFREFYRVCRYGGYLMLTNDVHRRKRSDFEAAGKEVGFKLLEHSEGYCPDAVVSERRYIRSDA